MTGRYPHLTPEATRRLTANTEPWMSCHDCFDQIDGYVECLLTGDSHISPQLRAHLIGCGACFEEAWSLLFLAADEQGTNPRQAFDRLRGELDCDALNWPDFPITTTREAAERPDTPTAVVGDPASGNAPRPLDGPTARSRWHGWHRR